MALPNIFSSLGLVAITDEPLQLEMLKFGVEMSRERSYGYV